MRIPERRFYQAVLWLPLILPILSGIFLLSPPTGQVSLMGGFGAVLGLSLMFGGVPYALFAIGLLWRGRHWTAPRMRDHAWTLPFWFGLFAALANGLIFGLFGLFALGNIGTDFPVFGDMSLTFSGALFYASISLVFSLVLGYGYVFLVMALRGVLAWLGLLDPEPPSGSPRRTRRIIG